MKPINCGSIQIPVLASGKGWLIVDKPAGMTVHNKPGMDLCSFALTHVQNETAAREQIDIDPDFGVNPVHRLDKEASGIILLAASRELFRFFSNQFQSRQIIKRYAVILHGLLKNPEGNDLWETWRWPLSDTAGGRTNPGGSGHRQHSETRYRVLDHSTHYTMAEIELLTGRTHQIRRHAKLSGHPVVGDTRYGSTRAANYLKRNLAFDRLALHARAVTLRLPGQKDPEIIETPSIPGQMLELFENDHAGKSTQGTIKNERFS
ncbi:MAG: RNA pseudouridine synthase [Proteobacteria bacterium]|nr:RNA pseudouridine synthase [Pseudomonadota bacterium]MBU1713659.1 RNA pseudouridine synthase [Pseudomonadota bacterium]